MGAFSNEGLFWIKPNGEKLVVNEPPYQMYSSHEEYAQNQYEKMGFSRPVSLEKALKSRFIRVQAIRGKYLFIDHRQSKLSSQQSRALEDFFFTESGERIPYGQYIVERIHSDMREFSRMQTKAAFQFAIDGSHLEDTEDESIPSGLSQVMRDKEIAGMHSYYQGRSSPIGDSYQPLGFKQFLEKHPN